MLSSTAWLAAEDLQPFECQGMGPWVFAARVTAWSGQAGWGCGLWEAGEKLLWQRARLTEHPRKQRQACLRG